MYLTRFIYNDFPNVNRLEIQKKAAEFNKVTAIFLVLLIGSVVVCTLGLLINNAPAVIGGMIISPLMWPIMQTSLGISYANASYLRSSFLKIVFATLLCLATAYVIAYLSPIKIITPEILARTNPTLIDVVIACIAGLVAAIAYTHIKVSESLAGVAIATSLVPPLCVSGIALALGNTQIFVGSFLLYFTNVIAIIFSSSLFYIAIGLKRTADETFVKRAILAVGLVFVLTLIPLYIFLRNYVYDINNKSLAESVITQHVRTVSSDAYISDIRVSDDGSKYRVSAVVFLPPDVVVTQEDKSRIQSILVGRLDRAVDLVLNIQNIPPLTSADQLDVEFDKSLIVQTMQTFLQAKGLAEVHVLKHSVYQLEGLWFLDLVLISPENVVLSPELELELAGHLFDSIQIPVNVDLIIMSSNMFQDATRLLNELEEVSSRAL